MAWAITLDSVNLIATPYFLGDIFDDTTAKKDINFLESQGVDGVVIVNDRFGAKTIQLSGTLVGSSIADLQTKIDTLNELFARRDVNLDITPDGGTLRRYIVRLIGSIVYDRNFYNNTFVPWTASLFVADGVGYDSASTNALTDANTAAERRPASSSTTVTFGGSAKPKPVISYTIDTLGKLDLIRVYDDTNTKVLVVEINQNWANGDIVEIDFNGQTVRRNRSGTKTAMTYRGEFPDWNVGNNLIHTEFQGATLVADQSQNTTGNNTHLGNAGGTKRSLAQSFIPTESGYLSQLKLRLGKNGTPGDLQIRVFSDNGGKPYANLVTGAIGFSLAEASIPASETLTTITDSTPDYYLIKGVTYWLVMHNTLDSVDNIIYVYGSTANTYANGRALNSVSPTPPTDPADWVEGGGGGGGVSDLAFNTYQGQGGSVNWQVDISIGYTKRYL